MAWKIFAALVALYKCFNYGIISSKTILEVKIINVYKGNTWE